MIALVIGASEESLHAIDLAKKYGLEVWAYDNDPNAKGFDRADKFFICDINKINNIIKTMNGIKPKLILPVPIGRALVSTGKLNDYWGLLGVTENVANLLTDKYQFHNILNNHKLRNIDCFLVNSADTLDEKLLTKFPYILKPRFGSGSREVYKINNFIELNDIFNKVCFDEDYVLEEAVEGIEYGIDGCYDKGHFNLILLRKKVITKPPAQQCIAYLSEDEDINVMNQINHTFDVIGQLFDLKDGLMHADIIINNDDIFIIEISLRPSGHYLHNIFTPHVTGIDMVEEFIKKSLDVPYQFIVTQKRKSIIHFFNFENEKILKIPSNDELKSKNVVEYIINFKKDDVFLEKIKDGSVTKRGYFIIDSKDSLLELSEEVLRMFTYDSI